MLFERDEPWFGKRMAGLDQNLRKRLGELSAYLSKAEWLEGDFSAGDLKMVTVLLRAKGSGVLEEFANLSAYLARGAARPAFRRASAAQLAVFTASGG